MIRKNVDTYIEGEIIMEMNKKEVKCEVCGLKIENVPAVVKGNKSYHQKCFDDLMEEERVSKRNALKVIGIGTAVAGATFLGVDRFAGASYGRPVAGRGKYPSPFILPGLFSDPPYPEPGQVWYRLDNGLAAYHDGIHNRNIYINSNHYVITVSAKGISNGLSTIPNDGADFGPDTMLNATSPSQIGPPYTQTTGIQEAINWGVSNNGGINIHLTKGRYVFSSDLPWQNAQGWFTAGHALIVFPSQSNGWGATISIEGEGGFWNTGGF